MKNIDLDAAFFLCLTEDFSTLFSVQGCKIKFLYLHCVVFYVWNFNFKNDRHIGIFLKAETA